MPDPSLLPYLYLLTGLLAGGLLGWLVSRLRAQGTMVPREEVSRDFIPKALHTQSVRELERVRQEAEGRESALREISMEHAAQRAELQHLEDQLREQQRSFTRLQEKAQLEFRDFANRLLEEKAKTFSQQNQKELQDILQPLHDKIKDFEEGVEKRYLRETHDRISLKKEIEYLRDLNHQLSADANSLAEALKGDQKLQGDWGELQLELLLERSGLQRDVHFRVQEGFRNTQGRQQRPDFIINLPEDKHLIIDSKVSLLAYSRYFQAESEEQRQAFLREHLKSIRRHMRDLSAKNYQDLYQINCPDYLLLFVPVEPAFNLAAREDTSLFLEALEHNIVLVTTSTLLATLRTVAHIWKQEKQKQSVQEIARQSGLLYDKFVGFVEDLQTIGHRLEQSQSAYQGAMNKLTRSAKFGDTLIGRAERIRQLGANARKRLPPDLIEPGGPSANEPEAE